MAQWPGPEQPYQNLPPLPPEGIETIAVLKAAAAAREALARVDAATLVMEDPSILINSIPLLEAQASSEIENIVTTNDDLFRAAHIPAADGAASAAIREALRYRQALREGYDAIRERPSVLSVALQVCSVLRGHQVELRSGAGTYIVNPATRAKIYTPPEGKETIYRHLNAWEAFFHDHGTIDPLVAMALLHYQFEAIHPFDDDNGRTGRILNMLYLVNEKLLSLPIIYLSGHIIRHKAAYYSLLGGVTARGEWEEWVLFMLAAVRSTCEWTFRIIREIDSQKEELRLAIASLPVNLPARTLSTLMYHKPYLRTRDVEAELGISTPTARNYLRTLVDNGLLAKQRVGRMQVYLNEPFLKTLFESDLPQ